MLKELYEELKCIYGTDGKADAATGLVPKPTGGGNKFIFVARDKDSLWHTLSDAGPETISSELVLRGKLVKLEAHLQQSEKYGDKMKLRASVETAQGTYILQSGIETAFAGSLLRSLAVYSSEELQDICIGVTPSKDDEKIVFAQVCKGDGSWNRSLPRAEGDTEANLQFVQSLIGQVVPAGGSPIPF